jgi:hypothetical protein
MDMNVDECRREDGVAEINDPTVCWELAFGSGTYLRDCAVLKEQYRVGYPLLRGEKRGGGECNHLIVMEAKPARWLSDISDVS